MEDQLAAKAVEFSAAAAAAVPGQGLPEHDTRARLKEKLRQDTQKGT